jgi:predicted RNase H-like HicB family nuclease
MFGKRAKITFKFGICVESDGDGFHAYCPALPGVHVDGDSREEAIENAKIAISLYIKSHIKHNDPIPIQVPMQVSTEVQGSNKTSPSVCSPQEIEDILVAV